MPKATILVVDDEQLIRWSLVQRLSSEGYRLIEAESGKEALARVALLLGLSRDQIRYRIEKFGLTK